MMAPGELDEAVAVIMEAFGLGPREARRWIADEADLLDLPTNAVINLVLDDVRG